MEKWDKFTDKAIKDPEFRRRALEDANKAIKEEFGEEPDYKVTYHITDPNHIVFILPAEFDELDDDSLNNVSGGVSLKYKGAVLGMAYALYPAGIKGLM